MCTSAREVVRCGNKVFDVQAICGAHHEPRKRRTFVYLPGGRFLTFTGEEGDAVWAHLVRDVAQVWLTEGDLPTVPESEVQDDQDENIGNR